MIRALTLALALLIAVTSQQMAVARGMTHDVAGQVILCTGHGPITVTLDHQGNPMELVHICPDCALTLVQPSASPVVADPIVVHIQTLVQVVAMTSQTPVIPKPAQARAPPVSA